MSAIDAPEWMGYDAPMTWWMGRVEDIADPKELGRVKVRVFGVHIMDYQLIPTDSLPWAQVVMPCTSASIGGVGQTSGLQVGSWVLGFFLDGARGQFPMVMGTLLGMHGAAHIVRTGTTTGPSSTSAAAGNTTGSNAGVNGSNGNSGPGARPGAGGTFNQAENLGIPLGGGNLTTVKSKSGASFRVNEKISGQVQSFISELEGTGYNIKKASSGGFGYRKIAGSSRWSQHAYGNAIDINLNENAPSTSGKNTLPANISEMAARHGLSWGGNFRHTKDPMHFEGMRIGGTGAAAPASSTSALPTVPGTVVDSTNPAALTQADPTMERYTSAEHPYPPTAKSPENMNGPVKGDIITSTKEGQRVTGFPTAGDSSNWGEPSSPDIGRYPHVTAHRDPAGNMFEMDSTPGGERIQLFNGRSASYYEIDAAGNSVAKARGDWMAIASRNVRLGAVFDLMLSSMGGDVRSYAAHDSNFESGGSTHIVSGVNFDVSASGDIMLKATGQLIIDAKSVKIVTNGGAIDIRSGEELNMEAATEVNAQSGTNFTIESKADTIMASAGSTTVNAAKNLIAGGGEGVDVKSGKALDLQSTEDTNVKSATKVNVESTGDTNIKSGAAVKVLGSSDVSLKAAKIHTEGDTHNLGNHTATRYYSPSPGGTASPEGAATAGGAADAKDPATSLTARKNVNSQRFRDQGIAGGKIAGHANANKVDPVREPRKSKVPPAEGTKQMAPRPSFQDPIRQVEDGKAATANTATATANTTPNLSASETDASWFGQTTGLAAASNGIPVLNSTGRTSEVNGQYHPTTTDITNIMNASKITGGGAQTTAAVVAQGAATNGKTEIKNDTKLSEADADRIIRTIAGEARGEGVVGQAAVANVILNRYAVAQSGSMKYFGTSISAITRPDQFSCWRTSDPNYAVISKLQKTDPIYKTAQNALNMAAANDYSGGALYYKATYAGATGSHLNLLKGIGVHNFYAGKEGGYTAGKQYSNGGTNSTISASEAAQSNIRANNAAQTMRKVGHAPSVAESSMLSMKQFTPKAATAWGMAMQRGDGWKTIETLAKTTTGAERAGWEEIKSKYPGKVINKNQSPIEHIKLWLHTYFRPYMAIGNSKWRMLTSSTFDSTGSTLLPADLMSSIDTMLKALDQKTAEGSNATGALSLIRSIQGLANSSITSDIG